MAATETIEAHDNMTAPVRVSAQAQREHKTASIDEKHEAYFIDGEEKPSAEEEHEFLDNTVPFPPMKGQPDEDRQFTFRAVIVGTLLGAVVSASNIYLGLKTSWTFGASLFGSILGFAILKPMSTYVGGGYFGPKEVRATHHVHDPVSSPLHHVER